MNPANVAILAFAAFAIGFPIWAMQNNDFDGRDNHGCSGACYEKWKEETGGVVVMAQAQAAAKAAAESASAAAEKAASDAAAANMRVDNMIESYKK